MHYNFLGKGSVYSTSTKENLITKSSTDTELVGFNNMMNIVIWTRSLLETQGYKVKDNIAYQDNKSTMLLAKKGNVLSGKNKNCINIIYFFVADRIGSNEPTVEWYPIGEMTGGFLAKATHGALFLKLRKNALNRI